MGLTISPRKVRFLGIIIAVLLLANLGTVFSRFVLDEPTLMGLVRLFDFGAEANIPTFFSVTLFMSNAFLAFFIGMHYRQRGERNNARYWLFLAGILTFLGIDEGALIHELLISPFRHLLGTSGILYFAWVVPYGLAVLAVGLLYLRFVWRLTPRVRKLIFLAGGLYIAGALGMELVAGYYTSLVQASDATRDVWHYLMIAVEETLEMVGLTVLIYAFLVHISYVLGGIDLHIGPAKADVSQVLEKDAGQFLSAPRDPQSSHAR
jgi:hypothetical protein